MENNEVMLNEEVFEAAEEITVRPNKGLVVAGAVVGTLVVGALVYNKLIKPAIAKAKAKKAEVRTIEAEYEDLEDLGEEVDVNDN